MELHPGDVQKGWIDGIKDVPVGCLAIRSRPRSVIRSNEISLRSKLELPILHLLTTKPHQKRSGSCTDSARKRCAVARKAEVNLFPSPNGRQDGCSLS